MLENNSHVVSYVVCYADTDAGGVVYYANYLKFVEAARTQLIREGGMSLWELQTQDKIGFVVRECILNIREPLRLDDSFSVITRVQSVSRTSVEFIQTINNTKTDREVAQVVCKMTCVGEAFKPSRIPEPLIQLLGNIRA